MIGKVNAKNWSGSHFLTAALVLCAVLCSFPSVAWELSVTGSFNWTSQWYSQRGPKGFFGPYNVDNGAGTRTANLNFWNGGQFDTNLTTSADSGWSWFNVELLPHSKIREAMGFQGKYRLAHTVSRRLRVIIPRTRPVSTTPLLRVNGPCFGLR